MKWLVFILCATCAFAGEEISKDDILQTLRHMQAIVHSQAGTLADAEVKAVALQGQVNVLADDRNGQAYRADEAENGLRIASAKLIADVKEIHRLKLYLCACAYVLTMALCCLLGITKGGWMGLAAAFVVIPGVVSGAVWAAL